MLSFRHDSLENSLGILTAFGVAGIRLDRHVPGAIATPERQHLRSPPHFDRQRSPSRRAVLRAQPRAELLILDGNVADRDQVVAGLKPAAAAALFSPISRT